MVKAIILGPAGSGKTTLAGEIMTSVPPTSIFEDPAPADPILGENWIYIAQNKGTIPAAVLSKAELVWAYVPGSRHEFSCGTAAELAD